MSALPGAGNAAPAEHGEEAAAGSFRQPEERIRLLLETIPVGVLNCDREGLIEYYNSHAVALWGRVPAFRDPRERYCGSLRIYRFDGEPVPHSFGPMAEALRTGQPQTNQECVIERPDGTRVVVLVNVVPHHDAVGRVIGAVSCMLDITDRKRAEDLAKAQAHEIRAIVENSPDPIVRYNRDLVRTYVNPAVTKAYGLPKEALLGTKLGSPIVAGIAPASPDEIERLRSSIQSVFATGKPLDIEPTSWPLPTGRRFYTVHLEPEFDAHGETVSVLCIARDITKRKRAEEALRESQRLLQQVLATLPLGVAVTAPTGDIMLVNAASKRIWGADIIVDGPERWAQSKGFWHDTGKEIEPTDWASARALAKGQTSVNELIDIETFDGRQRTILNSAAPIRNAEGQITGAVIVNEDVTEQKRREEKLRQTEAELARVARLTMMGELTATIAHEVNQPLAAVVTNASAALRWLAGATPNLDEACEAVRRIARDGARASEVIQRMRALMRKSGSAKTSLDLNELVRETLSLTQPELSRAKVSLETDLAVALPPVLVDRVQVQQVLLNLIVNAVDSLSAILGRPRVLRISTKSMEPVVASRGGKTRFEAEDGTSGSGKPDEVQVAVQDTGAGIKAEDSEHLFEPFYTTKPHGLGMGLAISRSIVESHGGRLWMTLNDGAGATFHFTLPIDNGGKP